MSDPFARFMEMWAPSCGVDEAFSCWLMKEQEREAPYVIPDIEPFKDTSGKYITGRKSWREHLVRTGTIELGHSDLKRQTELHEARKDAYRSRPVEAPVRANVIQNTAEPSKTAIRVMERLHGRPPPDRKTLIQIAIEERTRK